jgi:hypothetical protein
MFTAILLAAGVSALIQSGREHVGLAAVFEAATQPGAPASIAVQFLPLDPSVHVNAEPLPRLSLPESQDILTEPPNPVPARVTPEGLLGRYIDPQTPVRFAVVLSPKAAKGRHVVRATVTYFYCSSSAGWCRRASDDVDVPVNPR